MVDSYVVSGRYIMSREDRLPRSGFRANSKHTSTDTAFFYWSWRVFEIKPHPPFFLSMKVQKKCNFFFCCNFRQLLEGSCDFLTERFPSFQTENSGYWFPRTECVRKCSMVEISCWFLFLQIRVTGTFVSLLIKTPKHEYKTCHPKWRKIKYIFEFNTWIFSKAK